MTLERALEIVADYPLYGATDGITKDEALAIAKILKPEEQ